MSQTVVRNVKTKGVGFAPILLHYFEKCETVKIIDENGEHSRKAGNKGL